MFCNYTLDEHCLNPINHFQLTISHTYFAISIFNLTFKKTWSNIVTVKFLHYSLPVF